MKITNKNFWAVFSGLGLLIVGCSSLVWAGDTCGGWQTTAAKISGSKVSLQLSSVKDGSGDKLLQWPNPNKTKVVIAVFKAKGPVDAHGEIGLCTNGATLNYFGGRDSISIGDVQKNLRLESGYYAIRVVVSVLEAKDDSTSDWIVTQIAPPTASKSNLNP